MLCDITPRLISQWEQFFPSIPKPSGVDYLAIPGSVQGGTATFLGFVKGRAKPLAAVKIHRDVGESEGILFERDVLSAIAAADGDVAGTVPKVLLCDFAAGRRFLVQTIMEGRLMTAETDASGIPDPVAARGNYRIVADWLLNLRRATGGIAAPPSDYPREYYAREFLKTRSFTKEAIEAVDEVMKNIPDLIERAGGGCAVSHGDFCRHNILVESGAAGKKINVIDWTFTRKASLPLNDIFFFAATYYLQARKRLGPEGFADAFESTFFGDNPYSEVVAAAIKEYCSAVGVPAEDIGKHFAAFLIEQAVFESALQAARAKAWGLPRFTVYLASFDDKTYEEAVGEQLWTRYFLRFLDRRGDFLKAAGKGQKTLCS